MLGGVAIPLPVGILDDSGYQCTLFSYGALTKHRPARHSQGVVQLPEGGLLATIWCFSEILRKLPPNRCTARRESAPARQTVSAPPINRAFSTRFHPLFPRCRRVAGASRVRVRRLCASRVCACARSACAQACAQACAGARAGACERERVRNAGARWRGGGGTPKKTKNQ